MKKIFSLKYLIKIDNNEVLTNISYLKEKRMFLQINSRSLQSETLWSDFCTFKVSQNSSLEFIKIGSFDDPLLNQAIKFFNNNFILKKNKKIMAVAELRELNPNGKRQFTYFDLYLNEQLTEYELCCYLEFVLPKTFGDNFFKIRDEIISDVTGQSYGLKESSE